MSTPDMMAAFAAFLEANGMAKTPNNNKRGAAALKVESPAEEKKVKVSTTALNKLLKEWIENKKKVFASIKIDDGMDQAVLETEITTDDFTAAGLFPVCLHFNLLQLCILR